MSRPSPTRSSPDGLALQLREHPRERAADQLGDLAVELLAVQAADVVGLEDLGGQSSTRILCLRPCSLARGV